MQFEYLASGVDRDSIRDVYSSVFINLHDASISTCILPSEEDINSHIHASCIFFGNFLQDLFFKNENITDGASDIGWANAAALGFQFAGQGVKLYAAKQFRTRGRLHSLVRIGWPQKRAGKAK